MKITKRKGALDIYFRAGEITILGPKWMPKSSQSFFYYVKDACRASVYDPAGVYDWKRMIAWRVKRLFVIGLHIMRNTGDCSIGQYYRMAPERNQAVSRHNQPSAKTI